MSFFPQKIDQLFGFWVVRGLILWRNTCFCRFKSSLALNFHVPKSEMLALSKMWTSIFYLWKGANMTTTPGQSTWRIWTQFLVPETVFQESATKAAIGFFSQIKIFENTAFGHVTEVPIWRDVNEAFTY